MPALNLTYQKRKYRLRYEVELCEGIYINENPYFINLNQLDRGLNPANLEESGVTMYETTKYDRAATLTVKGPGLYLQIIITDAVELTDFHNMCMKLSGRISIRLFMQAYVYAITELLVRQGLNFSKPLVLPFLIWMN